MFLLPYNIQVYFSPGITDMRKSINGLSIMVEESMELDPFSGHLFVFCNRRRTIVKILYWNRNGFCLWQKRLEKHIFIWPDSEKDIRAIDHRQLSWFLEGLDVKQKKAHKSLTYSTVV